MPTAVPAAVPAEATDADLASGLRLAVMRLARRLRHQRAEPDLTLTQLAALATLDRHGSLTAGELAAHERVQPPSMTRVVATLEESGLVVRRPSPTDRRSALLEVSDVGRDLLAEDRRRRDAWLAQRLAELDPADVAALRRAVDVLDRLAGA